MSITRAAMVGGDLSYGLINSGAFASENVDVLSRTPSSSGNRLKWTYSAWVKRAAASPSTNDIFWSAGTGVNDTGVLRFNTDDTITFHNFTGTFDFRLKTTAVFRDISEWYHVVVSYDSAQAVASDRLSLFVNGVKQTSFSVELYPTQNFSTFVNNTVKHTIGDYAGDGSSHFNGYLSEIQFIDGQALEPDDFAKIDPRTGQWNPKKYSGTYGNNGFYLNFQDDSNLGKDSSGNDNDWINTGVTQSLDNPTDNFAILNSLKGGTDGSGVEKAGLRNNASSYNYQPTIKLPDTGKWYSEVTVVSSWYTGAYHAYCYAGVTLPDFSSYAGVLASSSTTNGGVYENGARVFSTTQWAVDDVIGLAVDMDARTIQVYRNNVAVHTPLNIPDGDVDLFYNAWAGGNIIDIDFGQNGFMFGPPDGYLTLSSKNLPKPSVKNSSDIFKVVTAPESNIATTMAAARDGWGGWLEISKNRDASEEWSYRFSHDSTNEYTLNNGASHQANRVLSGSDAWFGYILKNSVNSGVVIGTVAHSGGVATITTNIGVTRQVILLFSRSGSRVEFYHPDLPDGYLFNLARGDAAGLSTKIQNVTATSFDIDNSAGDYDYLVLGETDLISFGEYTGNGVIDGPFIQCNQSPEIVLRKPHVGSAGLVSDTLRGGGNPIEICSYISSQSSEISLNKDLDVLSNGFKIRGQYGNQNSQGVSHVYITLSSKSFKYSRAR